MRLHQGLGGGLRIGQRAEIMLRHLHLQRGGEGLPGQAVRFAVQLSAQRIVLGHQQLDGALDQLRHDWAGEVDIPTNVVQRRVAHPQLIEPDVLLGGSQGKLGGRLVECFIRSFSWGQALAAQGPITPKLPDLSMGVRTCLSP